MSDLILETLLIPVEMFLCLTGEFVLFTVTFGYHRPRWDLYISERPTRFVLLSDLSTWIGFAFWIAIVLVAHGLLGRFGLIAPSNPRLERPGGERLCLMRAQRAAGRSAACR